MLPYLGAELEPRRSQLTRVVFASLAFLVLAGCGLYDPDGAQRLFFHDGSSSLTGPSQPVDHSKAAAAENLERALLEPDQATAAALIRQALGYLR